MADKYSKDMEDLFITLQDIMIKAVDQEITFQLEEGQPTFYIGKNYIRFLPFDDHFNIEAKALKNHKVELEDYHFTLEGLLQLFVTDDIPLATLSTVFKETLLANNTIS